MPNPARIDFTMLDDGRTIIQKLRRDQVNRRDVPLETDIHITFDLETALDWLREHGYTVRTWYGGARAWKGEVWVIRTRRQIWEKRQQLEEQYLQNLHTNAGHWCHADSQLSLDLAYDG